MAMRWDPLLTLAFARELEARLARARVRALLLEPSARRIVLYLREETLVLELHPQAGWISLLDPEEPPPTARPFASRVAGVRAFPDESALSIGLRRIRGRDEGVEIIAEFVGNRWNGLVVGSASRRIRHVLVPRVERDRELAVGQTYAPPPSTGRRGVEDPLGVDGWREILGDPETTSPEEARRALLRGVAWTSSLNADVFLDGGFEAWERATDPVHWVPSLLTTPRGLQPYPLALSPSEPVPTLLEGIVRARAAAEDAVPTPALLVPAELLQRATRQTKRLEDRVRALERERAAARDPAPIRALGDLILARFHEVPTGVEEVRLVDFEGEEVVVELDPRLPPDGNARRYYDEAARLERARDGLPERIRLARADALRWREQIDAVVSGTTTAEELAKALGPSDRMRRGDGGASSAPSLPYRRFRSSGGLEIRVGKGARRNDDLTFRHSSPDDVWMHVREAPGAHVILRWTGSGSPPQKDLVEAATLAALHSEARHAGTVPVDWTRRKYVRKARKAGPGAVIPDRVRTIFVAPDPTIPSKLRA